MRHILQICWQKSFLSKKRLGIEDCVYCIPVFVSPGATYFLLNKGINWCNKNAVLTVKISFLELVSKMHARKTPFSLFLSIPLYLLSSVSIWFFFTVFLYFFFNVFLSLEFYMYLLPLTFSLLDFSLKGVFGIYQRLKVNAPDGRV